MLHSGNEPPSSSFTESRDSAGCRRQGRDQGNVSGGDEVGPASGCSDSCRGTRRVRCRRDRSCFDLHSSGQRNLPRQVPRDLAAPLTPNLQARRVRGSPLCQGSCRLDSFDLKVYEAATRASLTVPARLPTAFFALWVSNGSNMLSASSIARDTARDLGRENPHARTRLDRLRGLAHVDERSLSCFADTACKEAIYLLALVSDTSARWCSTLGSQPVGALSQCLLGTRRFLWVARKSRISKSRRGGIAGQKKILTTV
jgi:hypothetical protein